MARDIGTPIWQKSRHRWCLRVQRDGVRKWFYSSTPGKAGQRECEDQAMKWLAMDPNTPSGDPLVSDVYNEWVNEERATTSVKQATTHESFGRLYILPAIGKLKVSRLRNEQQLQKIINDAFKSGVKGKPLSHKSLTELRATLKAFVKYCRKRGLTTFMPENLTVPRRAVKGEKRILQPDELRVLFSSDMTTPQYGRPRREWFIHAYRLQILTGMRPGELLALKPDDVRGGMIYVDGSWTVKSEWSDGKNENARRKIPLTRHAAAEISAQLGMLRDAGIQSPRLFPGENGNPAVESTYYKHLKAYCRYNNITDVTPYELRHTFVSINSSLPMDILKRVAGHSESMDTLGIYGHEVTGDAERAANMMDDVMAELLQ